MENQPITFERVFNAPISKVWSAITNKDEMKNWYFDLEEFRPEVGFTFEFTGGPKDGEQYLHHCEITEVIPQKKLTHSWTYVGYAGKSFVTWELTQQGDKTLLKLTHAGLETFPKENNDFAAGNFVEGWTHIIHTGLKNYLEK
jgi:uncharacterized protein YndB with AHSA1/START domain